jgi:PAS domain S-box-containing protein
VLFRSEVRDGYEGTYSVYLQRKDESVFPAELNVRKVFYKGREARVVAVRDISDKKWAEEALRMAEARYRHLFENAMMGIFQSTLDGQLMDANQALAAILGFSSPEDLISSVKDMGRQLYVDPEQRKHLIRLLEEQGIVQGLVMNFYRKDKSKIWVSMNIRMVRNSQGHILHLQGIVEDITERKSAEDALIREKERFRVLVEESPFGVSMIGSDGRYKYINPKFSEMFGYTLEDISTGREWFRKAYPDPEYRCRVIASWMQYVMNRRYEKYPLLTFEVTCKDGTTKSVQFRPVAMGTGDFLMIYEDFTERRRLEEQLRQSEKLEAIGTLAGGIAHDFNNLLMGIQGYTSILQLSLDSYHPDYEKLDKIQALTQSGSDLTRQLLGFARGGKYEVKPADLNDILIATSTMFGRTRKEITIHRDLQEPLWTVEVDRSQIEQVLLNLYVNAGQAMPGGGQLYLGTKNVVANESSVGFAPVEPGNYVCITVKDTGVGMDEKTRQRIFEPFFTTREMRRGTGLGLASAYGIIQGHGGWIDVDSEKGSGTTFSIHLPASGKEIETAQKSAEDVARGNETVLLVDDEDINIDVVREILEILGYDVIVAKSGQEAVSLYKEKRDFIDLVILDMIMPGMGGGDTFDALKNIDSGVKVILSSGYSLHGEASRIMERGCAAFIQKPYRIQDLSEKLREVLDKKP